MILQKKIKFLQENITKYKYWITQLLQWYRANIKYVAIASNYNIILLKLR